MSAGDPRRGDGRRADTADLGAWLDRTDLVLLDPAARERLRQAWREIQRAEDSIDDRVVIGIVGGTGVGKSTLINALAGEEVSRTGDRRPTTDRVVVYRHRGGALPESVPRGDLARPEILHERAELEKVVLLDFPDFDSAEETHAEVLDRHLDSLDVILAVADDVKYGDRRLHELLRRIPQDRANLYAVLNKLDRLEPRYGADARRVARELLDDFRGKLAEHGGTELPPERCLALSARTALESRRRGAAGPPDEGFARLLEILDGYRAAKRRRLAKELNLEARRRAVAREVARRVLRPEHRSALEDAGALLAAWEDEAEAALRAAPPGIVEPGERRGLLRTRWRRRARDLGAPFSLLVALASELRRRGRGAASRESAPGRRLLRRYAAWLEALRNLPARLEAEVADQRIGRVLRAGAEEGAPEETGLEAWAGHLGARIRGRLDAGGGPSGRRARWLAHTPAAAVLLLALWSLLYPGLESFLGAGEDAPGLGEALVESFLRILHPLFLPGAVAGVGIAYLATALFLWGREVQRLDRDLEAAEEELREALRDRGHRTVAAVEARLAGLCAELEEAERRVTAAGAEAPSCEGGPRGGPSASGRPAEGRRVRRAT